MTAIGSPLFPGFLAMLTHAIGLIGAGQMATALGQGFVRAGLVAPSTAGQRPRGREPADGSPRPPAAGPTADNAEVAAAADVLFLAVKPQQMAAVLAELAGQARPRRSWWFRSPPASAWPRWPSGLGASVASGARDAQHALPGRPRGLRLLPGRDGHGRRRRAGRAAARRGRHRPAGWRRSCWTP